MSAVDLRTLVLRACANAEANGYPLAVSEASDILDTDADVAEELLDRRDLDAAEAVRLIAVYVAEYKAGARP